MTLQASETAYTLTQLINEFGRSVTLRQETTLPGTNPYPNPFVLNGLVVNGNQSSGASALNMRANFVNGRWIAGDTFTVAGDSTIYTVTGTYTESAASAFASVPITPDLAADQADGAEITPTFFADVAVEALVTTMPAALVNGTTIQSGDKRIRFLASAIDYIPVVTGKVFIDDDQFSIVQVKSLEIAGDIYGYALQVRR